MDKVLIADAILTDTNLCRSCLQKRVWIFGAAKGGWCSLNND